MSQKLFPAEWMPQSAILLAWPHPQTDWAHMLDEVQDCFHNIVTVIAQFQKVILLVPDTTTAKSLKSYFNNNVKLVVIPTNDTWARDFGPISIQENGKWSILDFKFNGWGLKFAANKDNLVTRRMLEKDIFNLNITYENHLNFVLEAGSIESDGEGTLLTTSECLLSTNRNGQLNQIQIEEYLKQTLGVKRILWLNNGYLLGDDTVL